MFEIEKNVPIPMAGRTECPFPFEGMAVGDSFKLPESTSRSLINVWRQRYVAKNPDKRFITRKIGQEIRCWRIK